MSTVDQAKSTAVAVGATVKESHPVRTWTRYTEARGNVLAGGIAYFAFFSVFPALAVGLTLLGFVMQAVPEVRATVVDALVQVGDDYLNGMIRPGLPEAGAESGIYVDEYLNSSGLTLTLLIGLATLLFTGLGWMDGMRQGIRAIFGEPAAGGNILLLKLRDFGVMLVIGTGVLLSVIAVAATNAAGAFLLGLLGFGENAGGRFLLALLGFAVAFCIDTLTFLAVFRVLPGADVPLRDLRSGAILGGVGIGVLKQFGASIAGNSASGNAFLGAAASILVLLILMNLIARLVLLAAAWAATSAEDAGFIDAPTTFHVPMGPPLPPDVERRPADDSRTRTAERIALASGVVLGAAGTLLAVVGRSLGRRVR